MNRRDFLKNCGIASIGCCVPSILKANSVPVPTSTPKATTPWNAITLLDAFKLHQYQPGKTEPYYKNTHQYTYAITSYKGTELFVPMIEIHSEVDYPLHYIEKGRYDINHRAYKILVASIERKIELDLYRQIFISAYRHKYGQLTLKTKTCIKNKLINQIELVHQYKKLDHTLPSPINNPLATQIQSIGLHLDISDPTLFEIYTPIGCWLDDAPYGEYVKGCQNHIRRTIRYGILIKDRSKIQLIVNGIPINQQHYTIPGITKLPEGIIRG